MKSFEAAAVKFLGISQDETVCGCCGRSDLKRTVVLAFEGGEPFFYGTTCAARALSLPTREVKSRSTSAQKAIDDAAREARLEAQRIEDAARWEKIEAAAFRLSGKTSYSEAIDSLCNSSRLYSDRKQAIELIHREAGVE